MSQARVNEILDRSGGTNATINGVLIRPGVLDTENRIINGAFDFWQRGTSFTTSAYGADRWVNNLLGGTVTLSRQSFTIGEKLGKNNPKFFLRQTSSGHTLSSHFGNLTQRIEGVHSYAGETITILGWARRSSGAGNAALDLFQFFGTGGSPSATTFTSAATITLTADWQPFAATIAIPSVTGKVLGTNLNDYLGVRFWTSAGSDYNSGTNSLGLQTIGVDFWGIHIRRGTHLATAALDYVQPELAPELVRCLRYYEKSFPLDTTPAQNTGIFNGTAQFVAQVTTVLYEVTIPFSVWKRGAPSVTTFSPNNATANWALNTDQPVASVNRNAPNGIVLRASAPITAGRSYSIHWVADSEL